jgi:NitT/TauT family transport system permease protein
MAGSATTNRSENGVRALPSASGHGAPDPRAAPPSAVAAAPGRRSTARTAGGVLRRVGLRPIALARLALLAGLLGLWELGYRQGWVDPFFFSAPSLIWDTLVTLFESGRIWPHMEATAREALVGLVLGFAAGITLGFLAGLKGVVGELLEPVMLLLNSVPRIVLAPIFILWLGIGPNSKIASAFFLVFVVIFSAVYTGLREVPPSLVARVRVLGGGRWALLTQVYLPSVLTWIFSSLRITVGFAFTGAVVAEVIASTEGLGYLLNLAQNTFNASLMMATVVIIMAMIMLLFAILGRLESHLMRWKRAA